MPANETAQFSFTLMPPSVTVPTYVPLLLESIVAVFVPPPGMAMVTTQPLCVTVASPGLPLGQLALELASFDNV